MSIPTSASTAALSSLLLFGLTPALTAQWSECHKLLPDDGQAGDLFGSAVATNGTLVAVGSPNADDLGSNSGSAYVFGALSGAQLLELVPLNGAPGDRLGTSIALDGARVAVGAPLADRAGADSGTVYIFDATTGTQLLELSPSNGAAGDQFGYAVAMNGGRVVVGGTGPDPNTGPPGTFKASFGAAYLFDASTGQQLEELIPVGGSTTLGLSAFGEAVAIDAGRIVVGARLENGVSGISGAAYVFDAASGDQLHRLIATNGTVWAFFGATVSIDGNVIAIGAPEAGPKGKHSGTAYLFDASTGQQTMNLVPTDGHSFAKFGSSVDVDGTLVAVGSEQNDANGLFSSGSVYVYDVPSGNLVVKLVASDASALDEFGGAVAVTQGVLASGAALDDDLGDASGSAYVFDAAGCACDPGIATYCTAKPGLVCGTPAMTSTGTPSASATSGFTITATPARSNKTGILLYTSVGRANLPFPSGGHILCVQTPVKRGGPTNSGGTPGGCDGIFALDMNEYASGNYNPGFPTHTPAAFLLTPGQQVNCQWWGRDSVSTGSFMSDAIEYFVCP